MLSLYQKKKLSICLDNISQDLQEIIIVKDIKLRNKLLKELKEALLTSFDAQRTEAINNAIDYLVSIDAEKFTKENAKIVNEILEKSLGQDLAAVLEKNVNDLSDKLFKSGISDVARSLKLKLSFDVADSQAAKILGEHTMFWILNYYSDYLNKEIDEILNQYFTEGKLIGEVASDFVTKFVDKSDRGFAYFEGLAEHTTYRVNELGKINGFEKAGIEFYEIKAIIDDRTSDICREMDGVIFPVSEAVKFRDTILNLKSPEDIKSFAPWRPASEILDFKKNGFPTGMALPPYHWRCRTITIAYFGDPPEAAVNDKQDEVEIKIAGLKLNVYNFEKNFYDKENVNLKRTRAHGLRGKYTPRTRSIYINPDTIKDDPLLTLLHETGHSIDHIFLPFEEQSIFNKLFSDTSRREQIWEMIHRRLLRDYPDLSLKNVKYLLDGYTIIYDNRELKFNSETIRYYTKRSEIFADGYAQFRKNTELKNYAPDYYKFFKEIFVKLIKKYENSK